MSERAGGIELLREPRGVERAEAFVAAGSLRDPRWSSPAATEPYARLILGLAQSRPHALLLAGEANGGVHARALVARSLGERGAAVLGLFEAGDGDDGAEAAAAVIDAAVEWTRGEGLARLYAPVDLNTWFDYRFALPAEGPEVPPLQAWEPVHPPRYRDHFRSRGFDEVERYESVGILLPRTGPYTGESAVAHTEPAWRRAVDEGFTFERLEDPARLPGLLDELYDVCMDAFAANRLFEPLPAQVFRGMYGSAISSRDASATHWARDADGRIVGFVFAFRDGGATVVKTIAVDPALRGRRLSSALMHLVIRTSVEAGVYDFVSALVREGNTSNFLSKPHLMPGVGSWQREYALLARVVRP